MIGEFNGALSIIIESIHPLNEEGPLTDQSPEELDRRGVMDSARDFYILSLTDIQILSPRSGFGVVGSMMALKKKHIMYHLKLKGEKRQCAMKPEGDELSVFADEWSGI